MASFNTINNQRLSLNTMFSMFLFLIPGIIAQFDLKLLVKTVFGLAIAFVIFVFPK